MSRFVLFLIAILSACGRSASFNGDLADAAAPTLTNSDLAADSVIDMRELRDMMRHHLDLATTIDFAMPTDLASSLDLSVPPDMAQGVLVTTFAGSGIAGDLDGPADSATFNCPAGIVVDSTGNVYVSDVIGHVIRKITPDRVVSTIAGSGTAGYVDGPGSTAEFNGPGGMAIDAAGNLIVAEWLGNHIRMVAPDGATSTVAGNGASGHVDGPAAMAEFINPTSVGVTDAIYVGDNSSTIRRISFDGTVSTFSGSGTWGTVDGPAATAQYQHVQSFAALGTSLLIADVNTIRSVASDGSVTTLDRLMSGAAGGIVVDNQGFIYFSNYGNDSSQVFQLPSLGGPIVLAGAGPAGFADGPGNIAQFNSPENIVARTHGDILVADCENHRIREVTF